MLIRVFKIPPPDGQFCFGGGKLSPWIEVDWFRDDPNPLDPNWKPHTPQEIEAFVRSKRYYNEGEAFLVLSPTYTFTINYRTSDHDRPYSHSC